jgi:hypothetical protein
MGISQRKMLEIEVPDTNATYIRPFANPYATIRLKETEHCPLELLVGLQVLVMTKRYTKH